MLLYRTTIGLEILRVLRDQGNGAVPVTQIKEALVPFRGHHVSEVAHVLKRAHWMDTDRKNRFSLTGKPDPKTLYELVTVIEGWIRMGPHIALPYWSRWAHGNMQRLSAQTRA